MSGKAFSISRQKQVSMSLMQVHVSGAPNSVWKTNKFTFLKCDQGIYIFENKQKNKFFLVYCIVQHAQKKSVFTFQQTKKLVSATINHAKPHFTRLIYPLRAKNWHLCCLVVMIQSALQKDESGLRNRNNISIFEEIYPPITIKHTLTCIKEK